MNEKEFKLLPELLSRSQVLQCGVPDKAIDVLRVHVTEQNQSVPHGKVGAIQLPGRHCLNPAKAKFKYRKSDLAKVLNYKTE